MNIDDALRALAERESWELDDLPEGIGLDVLRALDGKGFIELQSWHRQNTTATPWAPPTWEWQPSPFGWKAPIRDGRDILGDWAMVWAEGRARSEWERPYLVRVTDLGRAHLATLDAGDDTATAGLWLTATEVAELTKRHESTIRRWAKAGKLRTNPHGRIDADDLQRKLNTGELGR
ncbi:MAG: helix-turn-helix domain-containing protein [Phycisphaeraceae bacterium]|nr:helix-turn-helix domain-containing protein [Phycisphaeraceae bacterium]